MAGERQRDEVEVHLEAAELCPPRRVGVLARQQVRGHAVLSFEYDATWLEDGLAFTLDPSLALYSGEQYAAHYAQQFGIFPELAVVAATAPFYRMESRQAERII